MLSSSRSPIDGLKKLAYAVAAVFLALVLAFGGEAKTAKADIVSWTNYTRNGSSIKWMIDDNGVLFIEPLSGDVGALNGTAPWFMRYRTRVTEIRASGTITVNNNCKPFMQMSILGSLDLSNFEFSNMTSVSEMFSGCASLTTLNFGNNFDTRNVTNMRRMFYGCTSLTSIDVSNFDASNVTDMSGMFAGCASLTTLNFGNNFDTRNVTNMSEMFRNCSSIATLDLSGFDTRNVTDMSGMFRNCGSLTALNVLGFDATNVTNMSEMFYGCSSLTSLDLSSFSAAPSDMRAMFYDCSSLTSLNLSGFDTRNTAYLNMFSYTYPQISAITLGPLFSFKGAAASNTYWCQALPAGGTGKWVIEDHSLAPLAPAELRNTYDGSTMAGTWVWEIPLPKIYKQDAQGNFISGAAFELNGTPLAETAGGIFQLPQLQDGAYSLIETSAPVGYTLNSNQYVLEVVNSSYTVYEGRVSRVYEQAEIHNETFKPTVNLTTTDQKDAYQRNYQIVEQDGYTVKKSAEWTDRDSGKVKITLDITTPLLPESVYPPKESRVVYAFTTCTAHGWKKQIVKKNIDLLLDTYNTVDLIIANGPNVSKDLVYLYDVQSSNVINPIVFSPNRHWAINLYTGLANYLETQAPSDIFASFDRLILGNGDRYGSDYAGAWSILQDYQAAGNYQALVGAYRLDADTSTELGWKTIYGLMDPSSWNGYTGAIDLSQIQNAPITLTRDFETVGVDINSIAALTNHVVNTTLLDKVIPEIRIKSISTASEVIATRGSNNLIKFNLTKVEPGTTTQIVIEGDYWGEAGQWFDTNVNTADMTDERRINGSTEIVDISVASPKLYAPGYTEASEVELVPVQTDEDGNFIIVNHPIVNHNIELIKQTEDGEALAGATFTLTGTTANGDEISLEATSGTNGLVSFANVVQGSYKLSETKAPDGFEIALVDADVEVTDEGYEIAGLPKNDQQQYICVDPINTNEMTIKKVDANTGAALAGATFAFEGRTYDGQMVSQTVTTGADGTAKVPLEPGTYYLTETIAPNGYFFPAENSKYIRVNTPYEIFVDDVRLDGTLIEVANTPSAQTLTITKEWVGGDASNRPLPDIVVYGYSGSYTPGSDDVLPEPTVYQHTDAEAKWTQVDGDTWTYTMEVPAGLTFRVWEEDTPGYWCDYTDDEPWYGTTADSCVITNTALPEGKLQVTKVDDENNRLVDAKFIIARGEDSSREYAIINEMLQVTTWTSDVEEATEFYSTGNGVAEIWGLADGSYALIETEAPEGYVVISRETPFEISAANSHQASFEVVNGRPVMLPATGSYGVLGAAVSLCGVMGLAGLSVRANRKEEGA